ncbi:MAG: methyltransferase domain-containing protein [Thermotogae bacterium]|nr:methyltransferase domain-containing protein [Thermotogota bacterium]
MKSVFDRSAEKYDEWYESERGRRIDEIETNLIMSLLKPRKGERILDVGCGTGNYSIKLAKLGCVVVGIDPSKDMINRALEKSIKLHLKDVSFKLGKAEELPFPDEDFDAVVSVTAIEFFDEVEKAVSEMFRVLKSGGRLVIGTINRESPWGKLYMEKGKNGHPIYSHARFLSMDELRRMCENVEEVGGCLKIPPDSPVEEFNERFDRLSKFPPGFIAVKCVKLHA